MAGVRVLSGLWKVPGWEVSIAGRNGRFQQGTLTTEVSSVPHSTHSAPKLFRGELLLPLQVTENPDLWLFLTPTLSAVFDICQRLRLQNAPGSQPS